MSGKESTQPPVIKNVTFTLYLSRISRICIVSSAPQAASNVRATFFSSVFTLYMGRSFFPALGFPIMSPPAIPLPLCINVEKTGRAAVFDISLVHLDNKNMPVMEPATTRTIKTGTT